MNQITGTLMNLAFASQDLFLNKFAFATRLRNWKHMANATSYDYDPHHSERQYSVFWNLDRPPSWLTKSTKAYIMYLKLISNSQFSSPFNLNSQEWHIGQYAVQFNTVTVTFDRRFRTSQKTWIAMHVKPFKNVLQGHTWDTYTV